MKRIIIMKKILFAISIIALIFVGCNKSKSKVDDSTNIAPTASPTTRGDLDIAGEFYEHYPFRDMTLVDNNNNTVYLRIFGITLAKVDDYIAESHLKVEAYNTEMGDAMVDTEDPTPHDPNYDMRSDIVVYVKSIKIHRDIKDFQLITSPTSAQQKTRSALPEATYTGANFWHKGMICFHGAPWTPVNYKWQRKYCYTCDWQTSYTGVLSTWGCNTYVYNNRRIRVKVNSDNYNYGVHYAKWEDSGPNDWVQYWPN